MAVWAVTIPAEQWATERLFHNETVTVAGAVGRVAPDEQVLLVADDHVVALTRATKTDGAGVHGDDLVLTYVRRAFDDPVPADGLTASGVAASGVAASGVAASGVAASGVAASGRGPVLDGEPAPVTGLTATGGEPGLADGSALAAAGGGPVLAAGGGPVEVEPQVFRRLAAALGAEPGPGTPTWLVSLALPIEAATPADAVRQFWTHVVELGPRELPAYVWPSGDELAMQAFVLGEEANQDPEEDDED
ncbi:hypothetical protein [Actinoplanes subtropicus]|uniref:hypothetical protein n=1 Tax=Actinoplanes subtropicus TaxID=543632 RepID=UPI0004C41555|nr:hypothetical protein [Actinoplanes subtropicus]